MSLICDISIYCFCACAITSPTQSTKFQKNVLSLFPEYDMETAGFSEMWVTNYQTTRNYDEDGHLE